MSARQQIVEAGLKSLYPATVLEVLTPAQVDVLTESLGTFQHAGFVTGLPTVNPLPWDRGSLPIDRMIRSLRGDDWAVFLLAEPIAESMINKDRVTVIDELKDIPEVSVEDKKPNVLGAYYRELLTVQLRTLSQSLGTGAWRTAVYLLGDASFYRLSSVWNGVFTGEESMLEPVRVWPEDRALCFVKKWAMSNVEGRSGPGRVKRHLEHQTFLSSGQLAAYLHLPRVEINGFKIKHLASFGTAPPDIRDGEEVFTVGKVLGRDGLAADQLKKSEYERLPETFYQVSANALTKHVFIAGVTGAGKTRTVFHLLKEAFASGVNFLVIEPAKKEYRELLNHPELAKRLQVFTLGEEQIAPLRMNPFEVLEGTSIAKHVGLLRSLFSSSFGLWTPLPQILEDCLYEIYQDRGWNLTSNLNHRLAPSEIYQEHAFPTLSDLLVKVDEITAKLQWDPEAIARIRGNLRDRLRSLGNGARGRMLDTQYSIPMQVLLENPTVLELEWIGDDDDKAFIMGLILIRLSEYRSCPRVRARTKTEKSLQHLLVIEEAHRLLTNVSMHGEEGAANPKAKAVAAFADMLAEIRTFGQGVIIADQVPTKLAPDVIKNTNLKIAHRIVDSEDRKLLGGAMAMQDGQSDALSKLLPGVAAVYSEGAHSPVLVWVKAQPEWTRPDDAAVKSDAGRTAASGHYEHVLAWHKHCTDTSFDEQDVGSRRSVTGASCQAARTLVGSPVFQRDFTFFVLSSLRDPSALVRLWKVIESHCNGYLSPAVSSDTLASCVISRAAEWFTARRGSQAGWTYTETETLYELLRDALLRAQIDGPSFRSDDKFQTLYQNLHQRIYDPYRACSHICDEAGSKPCLYREAVADIVARGGFDVRWAKAEPLDPDHGAVCWSVCKSAAAQLIEGGVLQGSEPLKAGLCFAQMKLQQTALSTETDGSTNLLIAIINEANRDV